MKDLTRYTCGAGDGMFEDKEGYYVEYSEYKILLDKYNQALSQHDVMPSLPTLDEIKLEAVYGSAYCQYSVIENKLEILYKNQEKLLQAIKLLGNGA